MLGTLCCIRCSLYGFNFFTNKFRVIGNDKTFSLGPSEYFTVEMITVFVQHCHKPQDIHFGRINRNPSHKRKKIISKYNVKWWSMSSVTMVDCQLLFYFFSKCSLDVRRYSDMCSIIHATLLNWIYYFVFIFSFLLFGITHQSACSLAIHTQAHTHTHIHNKVRCQHIFTHLSWMNPIDTFDDIIRWHKITKFDK